MSSPSAVMTGGSMGAPIPLSEIEGVLAWVDTFKLSRPTKKINRDFSDAVLLAEMLAVHYPKLVEMHNYPPRNSQALKLNNWMTLNRKVLKKLKLNLCCNTMEQLANCTPGIIERVLIMVREKIRRDEELNKSTLDGEQNVSSGGSYYEACGDDENILMVPVKTRVHGVLETVQQKVVSYDFYFTVKEQLKDAQEVNELLKQKVDHLDNLLKLKDERITELQKQLERKQTRRKDPEMHQNTTEIPIEQEPAEPALPKVEPLIQPKVGDSIEKMEKPEKLERVSSLHKKISSTSMKIHESKTSLRTTNSCKDFKENIAEITFFDKPASKLNLDVERIQSNVFKEIENVEIDRNMEDIEEFKDSVQEEITITTIEETIQQEINDLTKPIAVSEIPGITFMN